jgi:sterol desaturase/sphingolipid hydroxylase (fatty acid hydroxylase superfamily)
MKRLLKNSFELYSILVCIIIILPLLATTIFIGANYPLLFHSILFCTGWIIWTWIEYHYHRFVLHHKTEKWETSISKTHKHHHTKPSQFEQTLLLRSLYFILSCVFIWMAHQLNNYFTLVAGLFWGWTAFCFIHYLLHIKWTKAILPRHHEFHIAHHCKYTDKCFGVSVMWWDALFGTMPTKHFSASNKLRDFYYKK